MEERTIVAPSTPMGVSALAVVRVSGPGAAIVLQNILGHSAIPEPRKMLRSKAWDPRNGELIDDLLFCHFPAPHSYTGEDVLELFPHGNPLLVRQLVEAIAFLPGIRHALPGEYTRRAFEAGKLDLVQAEAIGQLLHATADAGLRNARRLLEGRLSGQIHEIASSVREISALLELEVDFAEEEADADQAGWGLRLQALAAQLEALQKGYRSQASLEKTPSVVFYGAPNAGKSSLVNALLKEDRLLVSARAGTTRDVVEVFLLLDKGEVRLVDTAGLSENAVDELDALGQQKALQRLNQADLRILLWASNEPNCPLLETALAEGHWIVRTKADLCEIDSRSRGTNFWLSSHTGEGLPKFMTALERELFPEDGSQEEFWVTSERQLECLVRAREALQRAIALLDGGRSAPEELAFELFGVRKALESWTGSITSEDILQAIFHNFCIGK